jgi:hypothetical protein
MKDFQLRSSFILRVLVRGNDKRIELQDLRLGKHYTFGSWEALTTFLKTRKDDSALR